MPIGNAAWGDIIADTDRDMTSDLNGSIVGTTCWRTDVDPLNGGTLYVCTGLPATDVANWIKFADIEGGGGGGDASFVRGQIEQTLVEGTNITLTTNGSGSTRTITIDAAAGGGSGGSGGGGSDRTDYTLQADPVNGGQRLATETVDGLTWTYSYNAQGAVILAEALGGVLSRSITVDAYGFGKATGNIFTKGGSITVTSSQMPALRTALTSLGTAVSAQFYVVDFTSSRGLLLEWNNVDVCLRPVGGNKALLYSDVTTQTATDPGTDESPALYTFVFPAWLRGPKGILEVKFAGDYTGEVDTKTTRIKVNGTSFVVVSAAVTHNNVQVNAELLMRGATDLAYHVASSQLASGTSATSSSPMPADLTIAADTDLTLTLTMQYVAGGASGEVRTAKTFHVCYSHA